MLQLQGLAELFSSESTPTETTISESLKVAALRADTVDIEGQVAGLHTTICRWENGYRTTHKASTLVQSSGTRVE